MLYSNRIGHILYICNYAYSITHRPAAAKKLVDDGITTLEGTCTCMCYVDICMCMYIICIYVCAMYMYVCVYRVCTCVCEFLDLKKNLDKLNHHQKIGVK